MDAASASPTPNVDSSHEKRYVLGSKTLNGLDTLITPDTLMRWYRILIAQKWTYTHRRGPGRPRTVNTIIPLVVRMALDNRSWSYTRIQGVLANLGHHVGRGAIANILHGHGIDPAPEQGKHTSWSTFLKAHWECIAATDFFTVEVLMLRGLVTQYVLFFIDLASRKVKIAGITTHPREEWMMQMARTPRSRGAVPSAHSILDHGPEHEVFGNPSEPRSRESGSSLSDCRHGRLI